MHKQSLIGSFKCAWRGIVQAIKTQRNLWIELTIAVIAIKAGLLLRCTIVELAIILILIFIVLALEIINSAIEAVANAVTLEHNEHIRIAKDAAAGAVLLVAICAVIVGLIIYIHAFVRLIGAL